MSNIVMPGTENHRFHALCPYFAMFPPEFVQRQIVAFTRENDVVLDPFSGRGTTPLEALLNGRHAVASDINPVAYCVSAAKVNPPTLNHVWDEIEHLECRYGRGQLLGLEIARRKLPKFFKRAFHENTLRQLLYLRRALRWRGNRTHAFIAAMILGHLHGEKAKSPNYLSNQMPRSISTKPRYSLKYWRERRLWPPERDVFDLLFERAEFRFEDGIPERTGKVVQEDARRIAKHFPKLAGKVGMVITSPPYLDTTNFEEDQWLRLWFLGGSSKPTYNSVSRDDRISQDEKYWRFLTEAWEGIRPLLKPGAILAIRIGGRDLRRTRIEQRLSESLRSVFPRITQVNSPALSFIPRSQAKNLTPDASGCRFEVDFTYMVPRPFVSFAGSRVI